MLPDSDHRISLPVFEGPLDLLLFLIRKNEINIYDIPIESVTRQYLDALRMMEQFELEVAGEFFVMAATLMEIKSRMLLPKGAAAVDPAAEEEGDPRWELVHQLLEYRKFKEASARLSELIALRQDLLERYVSSLSEDRLERPLRSVNRLELWNTFNLVLRRLAEKLVVGEIHDEQITVSDQMEWLLSRAKDGQGSFVFSALFEEGVSMRRLIATFLAVLELTRLRHLRIAQDEAFTDIVCTYCGEIPLESAAPVGTV